MFDLPATDHLSGDLAGVQEADPAVEHVERQSLCAVGGLDVVVGADVTGDERGDSRFADELVAVHAGVDEQTELRRGEPAVVEARLGGVHRVRHRALSR